ncbi:MAG: DUF1501 domain-containing protein [Acidobacteriota bacterium]
MTRLDRRQFLHQLGSGMALAALSGALPRTALGACGSSGALTPWGAVPDGILPEGYQPRRVLEIFLEGGASPWESFWLAQDNANNLLWRGMDEGADMTWHCGAGPDGEPPVQGVGTVPAMGDVRTWGFGTDELGNTVNFGPATKPLWHEAILSRTCLAAMEHDLAPHEAAVPLALTGNRLGNPRLAGLGAAIAHREFSINPTRLYPASWVLSKGSGGGTASRMAVTTGMHPSFSRPVRIQLGSSTFLDQLQRSNILAAQDDLLAWYRSQYCHWLRWQGIPDGGTRSAAHEAYEAAVDTALSSGSLLDLLGDQTFVPPEVSTCASLGTPTMEENYVRTGIDLARHLLHPDHGDARYVCVIDPGLQHGYDSHGGSNIPTREDFFRVQSTNIWNACSALADNIDVDGNDPSKINLDDTLILINTEFGRSTNWFDGPNDSGRGHKTDGYATLLIGGPIPQAGIAGGLTTDALARPQDVTYLGQTFPSRYTPTDLRAAALLAAGVYPFAPEVFGVGDVSDRCRGNGSEEGASESLVTQLLGL